MYPRSDCEGLELWLLTPLADNTTPLDLTDVGNVEQPLPDITLFFAQEQMDRKIDTQWD